MDETKTKEQLFIENNLLKERIIELEKTKSGSTDNKLKKSEEKFRSIFEHSPLGKSLTSLDGSMLINQTFSDMLGYSQDELKSIQWQEITHPDDIKKSTKIVRELVEGKRKKAQFEKRYIHKNGNIVWTEIITSIKRDKNNKFEYFLTTVKNITSEKKALEKLRLSEERYRLASVASDSGIWDWWIESNKIDYSEQWKTQLGYKPHELADEYKTYEDLLHPDCKNRMIQRVQDFLQNPTEYFLAEFRMKHKDGTYRWIFNKAAAVLDNQGKVIRMFGAHTDISERKLAKQIVEKSEAKLRSVLEAMDDFVFVLDKENRFVSYYVNEENLLLPPDKFIGKKHAEVMPKHINKLFIEAVKKIKKGEVGEYEYDLEMADGKRWYLIKLSPIIENGEYVGLTAVSRDITERKLADNEIRNSEERLKIVFESAPDAYFISNMKGNFVDGNKAAEELIGYKKEELIGSNIFNLNLVSAKQFSKVTKALAQNLIGKKSDSDELVLTRKNGSKVHAEISTFPVKINNKTVILGIARDMTQRIKAENELRDSDALMKSVFKSAPTGIGVVVNRIFTMVNKRLCEMTGYTEKELIKKSAKMLYPTIQEYDEVGKIKYDEIKHFGSGSVETRWQRKNGAIIDVLLSSTPIDKKNLKKGVTFTALDITDSKTAEWALRKSEISYRNLFDSVNEAIYIQDKQGKFVDVNQGVVQMYGHPKEYFIGKTPEIISAPGENDILAVSQAIEKAFQGEPQQFEFWGIRKNGEVFPKDVRLSKGNYYGEDVVYALAIDITDRKKADQELQVSEERYRDLVEKAGTAVLIDDKNGKFNYFNEKFLDIFGYSALEMQNQSIWTLVHPDDVERVRRMHIMHLQGKKVSMRYEFRGIKKDGTVVVLEVDAVEIIEKGVVVGTNSYIWDITERKKAEETLKENEQKLRNIFENSTNLFYSHDTKHVHTYLSPQVKDILGYTQDEALVEWTNFISDNPLNNLGFENTEKAIATGKRQAPYELELIKKNGDKIWVEVREFPLVEDGKTKAIVGSLTDITERKRSDQIQNTLYNISNEVATTDKLKQLIALIQKELGKIIDTTNFYVALHQPETDKLLLPFISDEKDSLVVVPDGKTLTRLVFTTNKSLLVNVPGKQKLVKEGKIDHFGTLSKIWLGVPLNIEEKVIGVLAVQSYTNEKAFTMADMKMLEFVSDQISTVIHRKQVEEDIKDALEKATESERLKSAFLANMSHEIRTPMNGILGFTSLLKEPGLTGSQQNEFIDVIKKSGDRMLNTINDIIDFSKIEAGQTGVSIAPVNVQEQMKFLHTFFKPEAEKKGIQLKLKHSTSLEQVLVETDRDKVYAVLTNLIKNAIKYTATGSIEFACEIVAMEHTPSLQFYVKDTGMGIPKERQEAIFDRFVQADIEDRQALQGSGLGLAISKAYVEMLGGEIWVESEPENGSEFYFTIAYKEFKATPKPEVKAVRKSGDFSQKTVLIVEDVEISYQLLKLVVESVGITPIWAKHGREAIEYCKDNPAIDLVLMDISMPVMNGYVATKEIRKFRPNLPIIAQTAYARSGDREKSIAAGCVDYISKPIKKDELLKIIGKYLLVK